MRFRDTMQDIMPGTILFQDGIRELILVLMRSITASGRVVSSIDPASFKCPNPAHTRSDAIVWGIFTLYKYLAETGDKDILETVLPYYDEGEGSVGVGDDGSCSDLRSPPPEEATVIPTLPLIGAVVIAATVG